MARRTAVQRLLGDELLQMRLLRLPLDARYVWEHLVEIITRRGEAGVLRLGCELGSELGFAGWFAHWFRVAETEMQTHLQTLSACGLLTLSADAVGLPALSGAAGRRAETARANGAKGGRPRKTAEGQASMPLPLHGPLGVVEKPTETQTGTQAPPDADAGQLAKLSSSLEERDKAELAELPARTETETQPETQPVAATPPPPVDAGALADELLLLLGPAVAAANTEADRAARVRGWLDRGVSPAAMRQIVREAVAKPRAPGKPPIGTLAWFEQRMQPSGKPRLVEAPAAAMAPVPRDPRVAHLGYADRVAAERMLQALGELERAGGVPIEPPPASHDAFRRSSFARSYNRAGFDAVTRLYPRVAAWFGEPMPGEALAACGGAV